MADYKNSPPNRAITWPLLIASLVCGCQMDGKNQNLWKLDDEAFLSKTLNLACTQEVCSSDATYIATFARLVRGGLASFQSVNEKGIVSTEGPYCEWDAQNNFKCRKYPHLIQSIEFKDTAEQFKIACFEPMSVGTTIQEGHPRRCVFDSRVPPRDPNDPLDTGQRVLKKMPQTLFPTPAASHLKPSP